MTIASSGALRTGALRTEYGGGTPMRLGDYRRGHAAGWVKKNAANNNAVNHSAAVPETGPMRMSVFRGKGIGFTYTNTTTRTPNPSHYHCHTEFGDDWTVSPWPMFYINNAVMGSTSTSYYALVIYGRSVGPFTFTNNSRIEAAGGAPNSGAGQHAVYIYNGVAGANRPIFVNGAGGQVRGGGGAGGIGGTGGTGGATHYVWYEPGPTAAGISYARSSTAYRIGSNGQHAVWWGGTLLYAAQASPGWPWVPAPGNVLYQYGALQENTYPEGGVNYNGYAMRRQIGYDTGYGAGGGGGGNGGRGQGYNLSSQAGVAGANGGAGWAVNQAGNLFTGNGGKGGTGGTGGTWGNPGATGATGSTGANGTSAVAPYGTPGAGGGGGGAGGYAIYADSPWGFTAGGTISGSTGGGVAPT